MELKERGIGADKAAKELGVPRGMICGWLYGKKKPWGK